VARWRDARRAVRRSDGLLQLVVHARDVRLHLLVGEVVDFRVEIRDLEIERVDRRLRRRRVLHAELVEQLLPRHVALAALGETERVRLAPELGLGGERLALLLEDRRLTGDAERRGAPSACRGRRDCEPRD
jgi:hypothetical protein